MSLKERLVSDMKDAMKSKEVDRLSTIRMVRSSIKNKEIDLGRELKEDEVIGVMSTAIKQRRDSFSQFSEAGRDDLASKEQAEIDLLIEYLPEQAGEDEIEKRVLEVIRETGAASQRDIGKVMKIIVPGFKGRADGALVNTIVRKLLNK